MVIFWAPRSSAAAASCDYPGIADVRYNVVYDNGTKTGTLGAPILTDTQLTTAYNAMKARIESILGATWLKIPNPYSIEENSDGVLRKGYGIKVEQANNVQYVNTAYQVDRTFSIVICRESLNTDHDADGIATVEKTLCEDLNSLIIDFETNTTLNTGLIFCGYLGDSGVQLVRKQQAFLYIEAQFRVKMVQNLT